MKFTSHEQIDVEMGYHPATPVTGPAHDRARAVLRFAAHQLEDLLPSCPLKTTAINTVREAMWAANSAIACYGATDPEWAAKVQMDNDMYSGGGAWADDDPGTLLYFAVTIISNVSLGNWEDQADDWRAAARRFIDAYGAIEPRRYITLPTDALSVTAYQDSPEGERLAERNGFLSTLSDEEIELVKERRRQAQGRAA